MLFHTNPWTQARSWLSERENLWFLLLILVHLIPVWSFQYFPSQDGPLHLENAQLLREYYDQDNALMREYYVMNGHFKPNWLGHLLLAGLMYIVPILVAEKIFLSGYIILLPTSFRYAIRAVRPDAGFLAFMAFPFIYNFPLHMGFYNFAYSLPMFFFVLGYWLRHEGRLTVRRTGILALLLLVLYFCHFVSLVMACVAISLLTLWLLFLDFTNQRNQRGNENRAYLTVVGRRTAPVFFAFLPVLILTVLFLRDHGVVGSNRWSVWKLSKHLLTLASLWSFDKKELLLCAALALTFVVLFIRLFIFKVVEHKWHRWDGLMVVLLAYISLYYLTPNSMSGGNYISPRLVLYPFFVLTLWLGTEPYRRTHKRSIMWIASAISLLILGFNMIQYAKLNSYLEEYVSVTNFIEPHTTLLPLSFTHNGYTPDGKVRTGRISPFLFASGYIAAQKPIVDLQNHEARTGYFPMNYRPNVSPFLHIWKEGDLIKPPKVDFLTYPERSGGLLDYVLVWGLQDHVKTSDEARSVSRQLEEGFVLVYESKRGLICLYRRKDF